MIRKKNDNIEWLEFELFANIPNIIHAVFLRHGGVSQHQCHSLNAKVKGTGDNMQNVNENHKRMLKTLQIERLISIDAVHGINIELINDNEPKQELTHCDGLITSRKNLGLLTTHADCQTAIFYDPVHCAIANVHAGWRGQVKNIYRETISKMIQNFNTNPKDLLIGISPSLGPQNAEFKNHREEFPKDFWEFQVKPNYFDLWAIARHQLQQCGVLSHHIEIAQIDTYDHPQDFFSYRRDKSASGRKENITGCHGTVIALVEQR